MAFEIGKSYSFNTRAPAILGDRIKNVRCRGLIDYDVAIKYINVDLMHRQVYPLLPAGSPDDPRDYAYVLYVTESGENGVMCLAWIQEDTIEEITAIDILIKVGNAALSDVKKIQDVLNLMGYHDLSITTNKL